MAKVNTISAFQNVDVYSVVFDAASCASATQVEQAITVTGVAAGDYVLAVIPPADLGVGLGQAYVSAANTIEVPFINATVGAVDPASGTYLFVVARA
ncbi:MAG: hypothetical protein ACYS7Y_27015 [Planctomycetota bacterium]|jgi:hypothetical protein